MVGGDTRYTDDDDGLRFKNPGVSVQSASQTSRLFAASP